MFKKFISFMRDVRVEMRKVTWPSRSEVSASTLVIIISTLILGVFLGVVDLTLSKGIEPTLYGSPTMVSWVTMAVFLGILVWIYKVIQS